MRAVLDANVFVSSILSAAGKPARILDAWREDRFQLLLMAFMQSTCKYRSQSENH
jgi:predicted nucleic acid-binding protein